MTSGMARIAGSLTHYGGTDQLPFHFWEGLVVTDAKTQYGSLFQSYLRELYQLHLAEGAAYMTLGQWFRSPDPKHEIGPQGQGLLRLTLTRTDVVWSACGGAPLAPNINTSSAQRSTPLVPTDRPSSAYNTSHHSVAPYSGLPPHNGPPPWFQPIDRPPPTIPRITLWHRILAFLGHKQHLVRVNRRRILLAMNRQLRKKMEYEIRQWEKRQRKFGRDEEAAFV